MKSAVVDSCWMTRLPLASTVTLMELTGAARKIVARTALPYEAFITAAIVYLIVVWLLTFGFKFVERYLRRSERRKEAAVAAK